MITQKKRATNVPKERKMKVMQTTEQLVAFFTQFVCDFREIYENLYELMTNFHHSSCTLAKIVQIMSRKHKYNERWNKLMRN